LEKSFDSLVTGSIEMEFFKLKVMTVYELNRLDMCIINIIEDTVNFFV